MDGRTYIDLQRRHRVAFWATAVIREACFGDVDAGHAAMPPRLPGHRAGAEELVAFAGGPDQRTRVVWLHGAGEATAAAPAVSAHRTHELVPTARFHGRTMGSPRLPATGQASRSRRCPATSRTSATATSTRVDAAIDDLRRGNSHRPIMGSKGCVVPPAGCRRRDHGAARRAARCSTGVANRDGPHRSVATSARDDHPGHCLTWQKRFGRQAAGGEAAHEKQTKTQLAA